MIYEILQFIFSLAIVIFSITIFVKGYNDSESDLEKALVAQIEKFLLELGRGFMFVGTQQRITLNNTHYIL